ncbi:phosphomannomutase [Clostridia bacterium]|nr:phosphomannomutase [Clostridia bacterium]
MSSQREYERWLKAPLKPEEIAELEAIRDDHKEIYRRFHMPLEFGTAGLRGIMGAGLNRMNVYVVRWVTQAFANVIVSEGKSAVKAGVAIAYDCRNNSELFAKETASVLAANGISVKLFDALRPTPELSFVILETGCAAGVNITASHNTKEYNGYKVYWSDGAQLPPDHADKIVREMNKVDMFHGVLTMPFEDAISAGRVEMLGDDIDRQFIDLVKCQSIQRDSIKKQAGKFKMVFTPFHGTGYKLIPEVLLELGFIDVYCVVEQMATDGNFPTVASPNPENPEGFKLATELAERRGASLIIGSDPDADRVGVLVKNRADEFVPLSGNQTGALLLDYIIRAKRDAGSMPRHPAAVTSIVTTKLAGIIAERNNVKLYQTFTGFKFLAEKVNQIEEKTDERYILAFEESFGYMAGAHARDKDAVTAAMLIAEMATWYAEQGMTLYDALDALYRKYGHHKERTVNIAMTGADAMEHMRGVMAKLRNDPPQSMGGILTVAVRDYLKGERYHLKGGGIEKLEISGSDVMYFEMENDVTFIVRPSGTEPKLKVYVLASGRTNAECESKLEHYCSYAKMLLR